VLLVDSYEQLAPVDAWLRQEFVPSLGAASVVVLAGREPPAGAWRTDPGWRRLVAIHRLDHLGPADSGMLLARAGVAAEDRDRLVALGRGHPLALALLADAAAAGTVPATLAEVPELGAREHQRDLYAVLAASVTSIVDWVSQPLAWTFVIVVDPEFWGPFFDYLAFTPAFEVEAAGLTHVAYAMDWRRLPVAVWLDLMNEREHSGGAGPAPAELLRPPPIDRAAFATAVRAALHDARRPDRLAGGRSPVRACGRRSTGSRHGPPRC
jgi:hypothetical protein